MKAFVWVAIVAVGICGVAQAQNDVTLNVGVKVWEVDASYQGNEEITGNGTFFGPIIGLDLPNDFWISAWAVQGELEYTGNAYSYDTMDSEIVFGKGFFNLVDVGLGFRYSETYNDDVEKSASYGPVVYIGAGGGFGNSPLGWYGGSSWMFEDLNDDWEAGQHINVEGGLYLAWERFMISAGYRWRNHYDATNDLVYKGGTIRAVINI